MPSKIRVGILDDHQSIIDGYLYRLRDALDIEVVASAAYGEELEPMLAQHPMDVLLLDVEVPTSADSRNPYPILHAIPKVLQRNPGLHLLVISMHGERALIKAVVKAGAQGFVLKDDRNAVQNLANIVRLVANGGIYFSQQAHQGLFDQVPEEPALTGRQLEVLSFCAAYPDRSTNELAQGLGIADSTVRNLLSDSYEKLGVHSRMAAVEKLRAWGLVTSAAQIEGI